MIQFSGKKISFKKGFIYDFDASNGAGKTTFMSILSMIKNHAENYFFDNDRVILSGENLKNPIKFYKLYKIRRKYFSYIFPDPHLINSISIKENLELANGNFNFKKDLQYIIKQCSENKHPIIANKIQVFLDSYNKKDLRSPFFPLDILECYR